MCVEIAFEMRIKAFMLSFASALSKLWDEPSGQTSIQNVERNDSSQLTGVFGAIQKLNIVGALVRASG